MISVLWTLIGVEFTLDKICMKEYFYSEVKQSRKYLWKLKFCSIQYTENWAEIFIWSYNDDHNTDNDDSIVIIIIIVIMIIIIMIMIITISWIMFCCQNKWHDSSVNDSYLEVEMV